MTDFDPNKNVVISHVITESGCDIKKGEYSVFIVQFIGSLGKRDYELVHEAIDGCVDDLNLPHEGATMVTLIETGEWDPHPIWHRYYQIVSHEQIIDHQKADEMIVANTDTREDN